jgi:hypothetical protein
MRIRRISKASFRRNVPFWIGRQAKGEEIHLMQLGRTVGILYGEAIPEEPEHLSMLNRGKILFRCSPEGRITAR